MDSVRQYLISVVAAAIICGAVSNLIGKKGSIGGVIKFLCGLFMTITAISPLISLRLPDELTFWDTFRNEAQAVANDGETAGSEMRTAIITEQLETYILEKADSLGLSVRAEVSLCDNFLPEMVIIHGTAAPYAKKKLCAFINESLGIPEDAITWT